MIWQQQTAPTLNDLSLLFSPPVCPSSHSSSPPSPSPSSSSPLWPTLSCSPCQRCTAACSLQTSLSRTLERRRCAGTSVSPTVSRSNSTSATSTWSRPTCVSTTTSRWDRTASWEICPSHLKQHFHRSLMIERSINKPNSDLLHHLHHIHLLMRQSVNNHIMSTLDESVVCRNVTCRHHSMQTDLSGETSDCIFSKPITVFLGGAYPMM